MRRFKPLHEVITSLRGTPYRITSPTTWEYNCVAWAAEDTEHWWWPFGDAGGAWWPAGIQRRATEEAFIAAFRLLGYEPVDESNYESGFTRVAIYQSSDHAVSHVARQLSSGAWTSKCGRREDIEHARLADVGEAYGNVTRILRRPGGSRTAGEVRALNAIIKLSVP